MRLIESQHHSPKVFISLDLAASLLYSLQPLSQLSRLLSGINFSVFLWV
jgi:hypothetical protein